MIPVVCTGRGTHEERTLRLRLRLYYWRDSDGKIPTVRRDGASVPASESEYTVICRTCRPPRRVALTAEQCSKLDEGVLPALDISYMQ